jgi:hypothetical protein
LKAAIGEDIAFFIDAFDLLAGFVCFATMYSQYVRKKRLKRIQNDTSSMSAKISGVGDSLPYQNHDPRNDREVTL